MMKMTITRHFELALPILLAQNLGHIKKRFRDGELVASSVAFAVKGDEMARRILKEGVMLLGG